MADPSTPLTPLGALRAFGALCVVLALVFANASTALAPAPASLAGGADACCAPAPAVDLCCEPVERVVDACCPPTGQPAFVALADDDARAVDEGEDDDPCCPSGCKQCPRPCCSAPLTAVVADGDLPFELQASVALSQPLAVPCGASPSGIFHPPRG